MARARAPRPRHRLLRPFSLSSVFLLFASLSFFAAAAAAATPTALADVAVFAACLSDDACVDASFTTLHASHLATAAASAAAAQPSLAAAASAPLQHPRAPVVAHCVVGQVRTFSKQSVYEGLAANVLAPLAAAGYASDLFAHWGKGDPPGQEMRAANAAGWAAALSAFTVVGGSVASSGDQRTKLDACFVQIVAAETRHAKTYSHVLRSRPDLLWTRPLPPSLPAAADGAVYLQYDLVGLCPRGAVASDWPCDVPNAANPQNVGPRGFPAVPNTTTVFQYLFERINAPITELERHFEWVVWFRGGLVEYVRKARSAHESANAPLPPPRHLHAVLLNFFAAICFKYDYHLHDWAFYSSPTLADFVPTYAPTCPSSAMNGSPYLRAINAVNDLNKLEAALNEMNWGPVQGHYVQHDTSAPPGPSPPFDSLCGCRWDVCGKAGFNDAAATSRLGLSPDAAALTRALCRHAFANPLQSRAYYYHPPALHPSFDERDFLNASFGDSQETADERRDAAAAAVAEAASERGGGGGGGARAAAPPPPAGFTKKLSIAVLIVGTPQEGPAQNALVLESLRARLLDPYRRTHGHTVHVFLCADAAFTDTASRLVLQRLLPYTALKLPTSPESMNAPNAAAAASFDAGTPSLAAARACWTAARASDAAAGVSYDWVVRTRLDLALWDAAPDPNTLNATAVAARIFSASGIESSALGYTVKPGTLAAGWGDGDCNGGACVRGACAARDAPCVLWDEALNFVPAALLPKYFFDPGADTASGRVPPADDVACAWPASNGPEGRFTRAMAALGIPFVPITLEARLFMFRGDVPDETLRNAEKKC
jgi:hypothetical protein